MNNLNLQRKTGCDWPQLMRVICKIYLRDSITVILKNDTMQMELGLPKKLAYQLKLDQEYWIKSSNDPLE